MKSVTYGKTFFRKTDRNRVRNRYWSLLRFVLRYSTGIRIWPVNSTSLARSPESCPVFRPDEGNSRDSGPKLRSRAEDVLYIPSAEERERKLREFRSRLPLEPLEVPNPARICEEACRFRGKLPWRHFFEELVSLAACKRSCVTWAPSTQLC